MIRVYDVTLRNLYLINYVKLTDRFDDEERVLVIRSQKVGQAAVHSGVNTDRSFEGGKCFHTEAHDRDHNAQHRQQSEYLQR